MTVSTFRPADQSVRDAIRTRVDVNMLVEAGAGTGKTTVLVDRVVHLLAEGHADVRDIAVITFTEKAAAELAARLRERLEDERATTDAARAARIEAAIAGLNVAHIETIHAFAASILRERPVEARIDPNFTVLDTLPAQLELERAYDEWMTDEMATDPPPAALSDALDLGLEFARIREAAQLLETHRDLLPLAPYERPPVDVHATVDFVTEAGAELAGMTQLCHDESDGALANIARIVQLAGTLRALRDTPESLPRAIVQTEKLRTNDGSQKHWRTADDCRHVKAIIEDVVKAMRECASAIKERASAAVIEWLQGFAIEYERRRRAAGIATFEDLLIWSRDLLRDNIDVRRYFQRRYRHILIDEFQDTDPLQVELLLYICMDGDGDAWTAPLRPGSLFAVGDPKQSIYRFRRADIAMYDRVRATVFGDDVRHIVQNFRSSAPIIDWVNRTFARLLVVEDGVQAEHRDLVAHPEFSGDASAVTLVRGTVDASGGGAIQELRRAEASALASLVRDAVEGGAWLLRDGAVARYRDVTVLVPTRTDLHLYEDAFARAGVPYRHEGGRSFFKRQEVLELVALLRAIDDPADAVAAIAALRSAAFGCSDEDLVRFRSAGHRFDTISSPADAEGPVAESLRTLRDFANRRHTHTLPDLVRAVIDETRLVEFAMLQRDGDQTGANLMKVIDLARAFVDAGAGGLRAFVRWLRENIARTADETDASISEDTDDVVRIITIHAAKGLQFNVVVFANMVTDRVDRTQAIADRVRRRLHVKLGSRDKGFVTPGFVAASDHELRHTLAEEVRLLYVAATRARDRLVVPLFVKASDRAPTDPPKSLNDLLRRSGACDGADAIDPATLTRLPEDAPLWRRPMVEGVEDAMRGAALAGRLAWEEQHEALLGAASMPLDVRTASGLKDAWERAYVGDDGVRRGRAVDFGNAVHALLERIDLADEAAVPRAAAAIAAEFGLRGREREIERVTLNAMRAGCVQRALRSPRLLRETPFALALPPVDGSARFAEGQIDLLFEEEGALVIVDFKTDAVRAADVPSRAEEYRAQALVYAHAAHAATGMPVREVILLFARVPEEHRFTVDDDFRRAADELLNSPVTPR
jgi:ATP-dependent exoDNAse (exonuclease V) beta subunit